MNRFIVAVLFMGGVLLVGSSSGGSSAEPSGAASSVPRAGDPPMYFKAIRAEFIDLDGNHDEVETTCYLVNRSLTTTLFLGDVYALGPDGIDEVLSLNPALRGVSIPPLGTLEFVADDTSFPGLQPKRQRSARGLESVVVGFLGPQEALRFSALIDRVKPGNSDYANHTRIESHDITR